MAQISKIKVLGSEPYDIADSVARTSIAQLDEAVVHKAGDEVITGLKTFENAIVINSTLNPENTPIDLSYNIGDNYGIAMRALHMQGNTNTTYLDFPGNSLATVEINFPKVSGDLVVESQLKPAIIDSTTLPVIGDDNDKQFLRQNSTILSYPKGSGIIGGWGETELNLRGITTNQYSYVLADECNSIGVNWVNSIQLSGNSGELRGYAPASYRNYWIVTGLAGDTNKSITFSLCKAARQVNIFMTTGFTVAGGGEYKDLIPSNYDGKIVTNNINSTVLTLAEATQGTAPGTMAVENYTVSTAAAEGFTSFTIYSEGRGIYLDDGKLNFYRIEVQFVDEHTLYEWDNLADVNYVNNAISPIQSQLDTHTSQISGLDTRLNIAETSITDLQDYVGAIQIEDCVDRLPRPGIDYEYKFYRMRDSGTKEGILYQCLNKADMYVAEGDFTGMTGTNEIKDTMYDDLQRTYWDNKIKFVFTQKAFKDTNRIKFSNNSTLGSLAISSNCDLTLNQVELYVSAYTPTKPSVFSVEKVVDDVTTTLIYKEEIPGGSTKLYYKLTGLGITSDDRLVITADSYDSSQDRRLYINQIKCTLGENQFEWVEIGGSGLDGKMDKYNPTGTGAFSLNRLADSTVGQYSFAEGYNSLASGQYCHAEGDYNRATGQSSHAEGSSSYAIGSRSHAEGYNTFAHNYASHAEGQTTEAYGSVSHAEGYWTDARGDYSHSEGKYTTASLTCAHAEGHQTTVHGAAGHAEGFSSTTLPSIITTTTPEADIITSWTSATDKFSLAKSTASHVEGFSSLALGQGAHAEGYQVISQGQGTHAEGYMTKATANYAHAEGTCTSANGIGSHTEGWHTTAVSNYQHVQGKNNVTVADAADIVGWGDVPGQNKNLSTLYTNGDLHLKGSIYINSYDTGSGGTQLVNRTFDVTNELLTIT